MKRIQQQTLDQERALYGMKDIEVVDCAFDGPADGESALKEGAGIKVERCYFNLRYPFWHDHGLVIRDSRMTELCRAALWYSDHIEIIHTALHGIKALRECSEVTMRDCDKMCIRDSFITGRLRSSFRLSNTCPCRGMPELAKAS